MNKLIFAAAIMASASAAHATNLIANGDFSSFNPGAAGPDYDFRAYGNDQLTGWTQNVISGNNGGLVVVVPTSTLNTATIHDGGPDYSFWSTANGGLSTITAPPSGNANVFAQDSAPENTSYLSQTINGMTPGHTYAITFDWAGLQLRSADGSNWNGATNEAWEINLGGTYDGGTSQSYTGGTTLHTNEITNIPSHGFTGWQSATLYFVANSASEVLNLEAVSTSGGMPPFALIDNLQLNAVPEPATWAMMLIGVAGMGAIARRRRNVALAA